MSPERVIEYVRHLDSLSPIKRLKIYDDNASVDKKRFIKIISSIKNVPLFCEIRPDYITEDFVKLIVQYSKDPYILLGVESGSEKMLDYLNKGAGIEQIAEAFRILNKYKVNTTASFMIGLPYETKEDVKQTIEFVSRLNPTRYTCCLYVPFPGSPLYHKIVEEGLLIPPKSTEEWGKVASAENAKINVSTMDSKYLEHVSAIMQIKSILVFLKRGRIKTLFIVFMNLFGYYAQKFMTKRTKRLPL